MKLFAALSIFLASSVSFDSVSARLNAKPEDDANANAGNVIVDLTDEAQGELADEADPMHQHRSLVHCMMSNEMKIRRQGLRCACSPEKVAKMAANAGYNGDPDIKFKVRGQCRATLWHSCVSNNYNDRSVNIEVTASASNLYSPFAETFDSDWSCSFGEIELFLDSDPTGEIDQTVGDTHHGGISGTAFGNIMTNSDLKWYDVTYRATTKYSPGGGAGWSAVNDVCSCKFGHSDEHDDEILYDATLPTLAKYNFKNLMAGTPRYMSAPTDEGRVSTSTNTNARQTFYLVRNDNDTGYHFQSKASEKWLAMRADSKVYVASKNHGAKPNNDSQRWRLNKIMTPNSSGTAMVTTYYIYSPFRNLYMCMNTNGQLVGKSFSNSDNQHNCEWDLVEV